MSPTLGAVLRNPRLGLRLRVGAPDAGARPVRWVAISELTDPTPYLEGGELVLTTGVRWPDHQDPAEALSYVRRLAERGASGLGFGVAVAHDDVPADLLAAAEEIGLPLIEVPRPTPFMAVGKAVSRLLAEEEYEGLTRAFDAQRRLTQAALRGERAVVERLAAELARAAARAAPGRGPTADATAGPADADPVWVLLMDADGGPRHAAPPEAAARAGALRAEAARLRASKRPAGASVAAHGEAVAVQALGVAGRIRGFLATGAAHAFGADERTLVSAAASLLSLELEQSAPPGGDVVGGVIEALLDGGLDLGEASGRLRAALPRPPLVVAVADPPPAGGAPVPAVAGNCLLAALDGRVTAVGALEHDPAAVLSAAVGGPVGASRPSGFDGLPAARAEAERALESARRDGAEHGVVRAADLPGGFLGLLGGPAGARVAADLLAPLTTRRSAADLLASLRAYLAFAGRWDAAADSLGIHRHTLRYRINRIRDLLPGDLDDPDYRTELWLALRTRESTPL